MKRREFLGGLAAIGCQGLALKAGAALPSSAKNILGMGTDMADEVNRKARFDENAVVIISDTHVNPGGYQPGKFQRVVDDILKMRPLPQNVIALGDMAYLTGKISEYELLREHIRPLEDAGITLTMGMGNHDRRENFAKVFPSYAAKSKMKQFMTFVVETPRQFHCPRLPAGGRRPQRMDRRRKNHRRAKAVARQRTEELQEASVRLCSPSP